MKREAKKAEKKAKKGEHKSQANGGDGGAANEAAAVDDGPDVSVGKYGKLPMNMSREKLNRQFIDIGILNPKLNSQNVWIRARLHTSRAKGISLILSESVGKFI